MQKNLLDPTEAAEFLGVPAATLARWRCYRTGPRFSKFGKHVKYRLADLQAFVDAHIVEPVAEQSRGGAR